MMSITQKQDVDNLPQCDFRGAFTVDSNRRKITICREGRPEGYTEQCCLHPEAPFVMFGCHKDPIMCRVLLKEGKCTKEHRP